MAKLSSSRLFPMKFLRLFPLIGLFALSLAAPAQAGLQRQYDEFSNKTEIRLLPERLDGLHNLYLKTTFDGKFRPYEKDSVTVGFVISLWTLMYKTDACAAQAVPRLIVDGELLAESSYPFMPVKLKGVKPESMIYFDILSVHYLRRLAEAKEIRAQICGEAKTLTAQDMESIKEFLRVVDSTPGPAGP